MKRKLNVPDCVPARLEELLAFVDHLSPTVTIGDRRIPLVAVRLMGIENTIETFSDHKLSTGLARMRRSMARYLRRIDHVMLDILAVSLSADTAYTVKMEDGTCVSGKTASASWCISCVPLPPLRLPIDLIKAAERADLRGVQAAIEDGVDVNSTLYSQELSTALAAAATRTCSTSVLDYLLDAPGVDTEDKDANGAPILHRLLSRIPDDILTEFARRGAGMYALDKYGWNVLHVATKAMPGMDRHVQTILRYAPILTLHTDRDGNAPAGGVALFESTREKMMACVTAIIDSVICVKAVRQLVLGYYTRIV
jgi:hypothetical protein